MNILIVDDDADDIELITQALNEIDVDIKCMHAFNGQQALDMLKGLSKQPDCIFLDLNMPRMGGKNFLKHLKASAALKQVPVIVLSTSKQAEDIHEVTQHGAKAFIIKPPKFTLLIQEIKSSLLLCGLS